MITPEIVPEDMVHMWLLRIADFNTVIEPGLYIFLQRETLAKIAKCCIHRTEGYAQLDGSPET
jgi:hypothetical protein